MKDTTTKPRRPAQTGTGTTGAQPTPQTPAVPRIRQLGAAAQQEALMQQLLSDTTPLNLSTISYGGGSDKPGPRGNIFGFYVEPPKPPPPPPPPPPIQLTLLQPQSAVAGTPRAFTLTVSGNKIPADAQILFDGSPRVTKRVSETQLSTEVAAGDYAFARNINVEVKSKSDAANNSNPISFVVQAPPEPPFVYKGRLGPLNQPQYNYAVFELQATKEIKRAKVGETINGVWRVDAISADAVEVTLTQYDIKRRLPLQDKVR
ncbi:MAG: hypothetical protein WAV47_21275 [Blastocatellia bacterium]